MHTEFYYSKETAFSANDLVKKDGEWFKFDDISDNQIKIWHSLFSADCEINAYMRNRFSNGVKDCRELVRLCCRKFFGKATPEPDIDENGKLHKETH